MQWAPAPDIFDQAWNNSNQYFFLIISYRYGTSTHTRKHPTYHNNQIIGMVWYQIVHIGDEVAERNFQIA